MHPAQAKALIDQASALVAQILRFEHPSDAVLTRFFRERRHLHSRDRAMLAETAYTVLRQKNRLEMLARTAPQDTGSHARHMAVLACTAPPDFLQAGLSVRETAWLKECETFAQTQLQDIHRHNLPDWLAALLQERLGEAGFWALSAALLKPASVDLRINTLLAKRKAVLDTLQQVGIQATPTPYSPWGLRIHGKRPFLQQLDSFQQGLIEVQDEGSQLLALLVGPKRGETVVDFCAGAGGKTLALGVQMRDTGRLYAFDTSAHRLAALKPRLVRAKLSNVYTVALTHADDERAQRLRGKVDRVLVDAPCSGLGTLRRNPDLKWRYTPHALAEFNTRQTTILQNAATLLKPGGRLVYATCSILYQENERIAEAFGRQHPEYERLDVGNLLDHATLAHDGYLQLWPHIHHTDGFFAAVWEKA